MIALTLVLTKTFSAVFYILYIIGGLTDMLDGFVARKTQTASDFGAKLDSVADFLFVAVCLVKILPVLQIPSWLLLWIILIALIEFANLIFAYHRWHKLCLFHTKANKTTGFLLFLLPLTLGYFKIEFFAISVCFMAFFAALQESYLISKGNILQG